VLQVRPRSHTTKLIHLKPGVSSRPGFNAQSVDSLSVEQDGNPGTGTPNNVELNTPPATIKYGATCPSGITAAFCGDVTLNSFYTRPLNNVFVQVTSITGTYGNDLSTTHNAIGSDSAPSWMTGTSSMGLWKYTATSATTAGVIGTSPNNSGTRTWEFKDPDGADTNILLRVVSTLTYKNYSISSSSQAFFNACTLTNAGKIKTADVSATMPFGFTFYNLPATTSALFNRDGVVAFGGASPPNGLNTPFASTTLPENPASISVSPGVYVFWDMLNFNSSAGGLCYGTTGAAPNRQFVFTWRNLKGYGNGDNTTALTFNAVLSEGTDTIDFVYGSMGSNVGADATYPTITNAQRASGAKAVVGIQGPSGGVNIATPASAAMGGTDTSTGKAYRFTPVP
jgi:hypothetical protein